MRKWTRSALVLVMACRPSAMLTYCQLHSWKQISMKFESEFCNFHWRKCIWNCRLPFCQGVDEFKQHNQFVLLSHHWLYTLLNVFRCEVYLLPCTAFMITIMTSSNGNIVHVTGPFVQGIHRASVNSPHKGQCRVALMFSLICTWINGWVNNREAGDLRRHRSHYDFIVMQIGDCKMCETSYTRFTTWIVLINTHSFQW